NLYTLASTDGTINPPPMGTPLFPTDGSGKICINGSTPLVQNNDYATYWGVELAFELCNVEGVAHSLGACPAPIDIIGIKFNVTATPLPTTNPVNGKPGSLNLQLYEPNAWITFMYLMRGENIVMLDDARAFNDSDQHKADVSNVQSLRFRINTNGN